MFVSQDAINYNLHVQVKALYQKISNDNESLKGLWAAKLNLKGKGGTVSKEDMEKFDSQYKQLQSELERRKDLGKKFDTVLLHMKRISDADEVSREEHQVGGATSSRYFIK